MGTLCGWIGALLITIAIVGIVEAISRTRLPFGWLGNIVVGFIGGMIGQYLLGQFGPALFGVYLIPTFIGSLLFVIVAKFIFNALGQRRV